MIKEVELNLVKDIIIDYFKNEIPGDFNITPYNKSLVYISDDNIRGILNYDLIYDRIEINYIIVIEKYRMHGIGSKLINYLINNNDVLNITLEVRENNLPAIKLYEKFGFKKNIIRKNYYNGEDAIMMIRT